MAAPVLRYLDPSTSSAWNASVQAFLDDNHIVDEKALNAFFGTVGPSRNIPFPSSFPSKRFAVTRNGALPTYGRQQYSLLSFPRESFQRIATQFNLTDKFILYGATGGGKSHILAEYVLYLHCRRCMGLVDAPRVLYIPSLKDSTLQVKTMIGDALKYCFPECTAQLNLHPQWTLQQQFDYCQQNVQNVHVLGVFDDWHYFEDSSTKAARESLKDSLLEMTTTSIVSLSYSPQFTVDYLIGRTRIECDYALSDAEMDVWRGQAPYNTLFGGAAALPNEIKDLTGFIPLILHSLCSYNLNNFEAALERFDNDPHKDNLGGTYICAELLEFYNKCNDKRKHCEIMSASLAYQNVSSYTSFNQLYHRGFFSYNDSNGSLTPVCGLVARYMADILLEYEKTSLADIWTEDWVNGALQCDNSSVRSFAFERYVIGLIANRSRLVFDLILQGFVPKVVFFRGDYPPTVTASLESTATLYVPKKWNLARVDCVLRIVKLQTSKKAKTGHVNQSHISRHIVDIYSVKITTQLPTEHQDTLQFFALDENGHAPCHNFTTPEDTVRHYLVWITPHSVFRNGRQVHIDAGKLPHTPGRLTTALEHDGSIRSGQVLYTIKSISSTR